MKDIYEVLLTVKNGEEETFILLVKNIPFNYRMDHKYYIVLRGTIPSTLKTENDTKVRNYLRIEMPESDAIFLQNIYKSWFKYSIFKKYLNFNKSKYLEISINNEDKRNIKIAEKELFNMYALLKMHINNRSLEENYLESLIKYDEDVIIKPGWSRITDCLITHNRDLLEIARTGTHDNLVIILKCQKCLNHFSLNCIEHAYGGYDEFYSPINQNEAEYINKKEFEKVNSITDIIIINDDTNFKLAPRTHYYANKYMHSFIFQ
jgi:hypothetical protein